MFFSVYVIFVMFSLQQAAIKKKIDPILAQVAFLSIWHQWRRSLGEAENTNWLSIVYPVGIVSQLERPEHFSEHKKFEKSSRKNF